jgi:hypothetical protein
MHGFQRTCLTVLAVAATVAAMAVPASAATVAGSPRKTWQTVGSLDAKSRNTQGQVSVVAYGRRASRGRVFLGGNFTRVKPPRGTSGNSVRRLHLAALTVKGGRLVSSWKVPVKYHGSAADGRVESMAVSRNGKVLYVGGRFSTIGGKTRSNVAALGTRTGRVLGWAPKPNGRVHAIAVTRSRIFLGGTFTAVNGARHAHLAAIRRRGGAPIAGFHADVTQIAGSCPPRCAPDVHAIQLSRDGSTVFFGGAFGMVNGRRRDSAAAVSAAGGHVKRWNPSVFSSGGGGSLNTVHDMIRNGKRMVLCGDFYKVNASTTPHVSPNLAAVNLRRGKFIAKFNAAADGSVNSCALHKRAGLIFLGGHFDHAGTRGAVVAKTAPTRHHLAAVGPRTGSLSGWSPDANSVPGAFAVAVQKTHVAFGGQFTTINGLAQAGFAQFGVT